MSSKIDICNMALSKLSAKRITSFDDNTIEAQQAAATYDMISETVQAAGPWPCNKFRATLAQDAVAPAFGFQFRYPLPVDPKCLRVLRLNEDELGDINYQIEGNYLLTDESSIGILYIGLVTNPQDFDTFLRDSIIDHLIAAWVFKLTGQATITKDLMDYAAKHQEHLLNMASIQGSTDEWPSDEFVDVRRQT